ncbi:MAG: MBL fold metallo-hydrolase [Candidatus Thermoplasmatota archaeon]|nr:MBL fold metallo-hydrolase [Candidatus Thermoplasmatota archaeon]
MDLSVEIEKLVVGPLFTNCYIIQSGNDAIVVDPGGDPYVIQGYIASRKLNPVKVVATHSHFDHVLSAKAICENSGLKLTMHRREGQILQSSLKPSIIGLGYEDVQLPDIEWIGNQVEVKLGDSTVSLLETPGHTPGSVSLLVEGTLLSGDTLFRGSIGRTDFGGNYAEIMTSLGKLKSYPDETRVLPGHGPESTIYMERRTNPFLREP